MARVTGGTGRTFGLEIGVPLNPSPLCKGRYFSEPSVGDGDDGIGQTFFFHAILTELVFK